MVGTGLAESEFLVQLSAGDIVEHHLATAEADEEQEGLAVVGVGLEEVYGGDGSLASVDLVVVDHVLEGEVFVLVLEYADLGGGLDGHEERSALAARLAESRGTGVAQRNLGEVGFDLVAVGVYVHATLDLHFAPCPFALPTELRIKRVWLRVGSLRCHFHRPLSIN